MFAGVSVAGRRRGRDTPFLMAGAWFEQAVRPGPVKSAASEDGLLLPHCCVWPLSGRTG